MPPKHTHSHQNSQWKSNIYLVWSHWEQQRFSPTQISGSWNHVKVQLQEHSYAYVSSPKTKCGSTNHCLCFNLSYEVIWQVANPFWVRALFYMDYVVDFLFSQHETPRGSIFLLFYCLDFGFIILTVWAPGWGTCDFLKYLQGNIEKLMLILLKRFHKIQIEGILPNSCAQAQLH